jgi:hypothetical protein
VGIRKYENLRQTKEAGQDWRAELEDMVAGRKDPDAVEYIPSWSASAPDSPPDIEPKRMDEIRVQFRAYEGTVGHCKWDECGARYAQGKLLAEVKAAKVGRWVKWTNSEDALRQFNLVGSTLRELERFAQLVDGSDRKDELFRMGYYEARVNLRMRKPSAVGPAHPDCPPAIAPTIPVGSQSLAPDVPTPPAAPALIDTPVATVVATKPPAPAAPELLTPERFQVESRPGSIEIRMVAEPSVESICAVLRQGAVSAAFLPGKPVTVRVVPVGRLEPQDLEAQSAEVEKLQKRKRDPELPPPLFPPESKK